MSVVLYSFDFLATILESSTGKFFIVSTEKIITSRAEFSA
uniref:Uncharacterized protein n=2 Tax=Klebsiella TaxID=570 RepID=A0A286NCC0_KLEPN|nr:hypothetical protein [Klebsiella pneumoniae]AVX33833.1 Hypothetical protein [Klebsiella aerogenes]